MDGCRDQLKTHRDHLRPDKRIFQLLPCTPPWGAIRLEDNVTKGLQEIFLSRSLSQTTRNSSNHLRYVCTKEGHEDSGADKPLGKNSTAQQMVLRVLKYSHPSVKSTHKSRLNSPGNTTDGHRAQIKGILPAHLTEISTSTLKRPSQK